MGWQTALILVLSFSLVMRCAGVAQSVEQLICNQQVGGSNPSTSSTILYGGIPERPNGADCKSVVTDFGGSNPPSPTRKHSLRVVFLFLFCGFEGEREWMTRRWRVRAAERPVRRRANPPSSTKNPNAKAFGFLLFTFYLFTITLNRIRIFGKVISKKE